MMGMAMHGDSHGEGDNDGMVVHGDNHVEGEDDSDGRWVRLCMVIVMVRMIMTGMVMHGDSHGQDDSDGHGYAR